MIEIMFDKQPAEFQPGEMISGIINWNDLKKENWAFETRLLWHTDRRSDTSQKWQPLVGRQRARTRKIIAHQQTVATSSKGSRPYMFPAPIGPFSFTGKLLTLRWVVEVETADETYSEPLTLSLTGKEILLQKSFENGELNPPKKELSKK